jgi:hypothetical protein
MEKPAIADLKQRLTNIALDIGTLPSPELVNLVEFTTATEPVIRNVQACANALMPSFPTVAGTLETVATALTDVGEAIQTDQDVSNQPERIAFRQRQISTAQDLVNAAIENIR